MPLPFFEFGVPRLDAIVHPGMLCAFDFDGTLAPIVSDPARVCMPAAISRRLNILTKHARVAIISGRTAQDVGARLDFRPDFVVGNHGIEGVPGWEGRAEYCRQLCHAWEQRLALALSERALFDPGIWIEHKTYTLSVHYRMAGNRPKAVAELLRLFATLVPAARIVGGKCVFNLVPPDAPDKGTALAGLCEASGAGSAIYVGDDVTDEDVFRLRREDWLTVRIEHSAVSAAQFYLHHRLDMGRLIDALITRLSPTSRAPR
jgi:trehalose 6-phosphate phosphatase